MDKLAAMRTFVRIVEAGSLTNAANTLDTSLPTVVRTLAALERELGVSLLKRTTRRIHLTDEGAQYVERCRDILTATQEAEDLLVARRTEPVGKLSVTASVAFGRRYLTPIVYGFLQRYPKVTADVLLVDRVVDLVDEGMDVAIRIAHLRDLVNRGDRGRARPPRCLREREIPAPVWRSANTKRYSNASVRQAFGSLSPQRVALSCRQQAAGRFHQQCVHMQRDRRRRRRMYRGPRLGHVPVVHGGTLEEIGPAQVRSRRFRNGADAGSGRLSADAADVQQSARLC